MAFFEGDSFATQTNLSNTQLPPWKDSGPATFGSAVARTAICNRAKRRIFSIGLTKPSIIHRYIGAKSHQKYNRVYANAPGAVSSVIGHRGRTSASALSTSPANKRRAPA